MANEFAAEGRKALTDALTKVRDSVRVVGHTPGPWLFDGEGQTFADRPGRTLNTEAVWE